MRKSGQGQEEMGDWDRQWSGEGAAVARVRSLTEVDGKSPTKAAFLRLKWAGSEGGGRE